MSNQLGSLDQSAYYNQHLNNNVEDINSLKTKIGSFKNNKLNSQTIKFKEYILYLDNNDLIRLI